MASPSDKALTAPQKALRKLGLLRPIDLALHLPLRYADETQLKRLDQVREGEMAQVQGEIIKSEVRFGGQRQLLVTIDDGSQTCLLRFFSFYPSQQRALAVGKRIRVLGEIRGGFMGLTMMHPTVKVADAPLPNSLTPIYPTSAGLPQAYLRRAVDGGLAQADLSETLPAPALQRLRLDARWTLKAALQFLHHPTPDVTMAELEDRSHPAWQRLKAEELLAQQLSQTQAKQERAALRAPVLRADPQHGATPLLERLLAALPFALTAAQQRVGDEIAADLARAVPMHRLLQGDVGAGKTVVAALAAARCIDAGWQCALMAPTEILATQHFAKLLAWLQPLGVTVAWLTGSQKTKERREMLALVASGQAQLVVGTHAMIQEHVQFQRLALAIIDEQHRFGVAQRLALRSKMAQDDTENAQMEPHLLMMTATPIPRTLAMSYYADLDVSVIDTLPPGRTPIVTKVISEQRRDEVIARIQAQLLEGRQVYWVCPLIEESEVLDLRNATETHAHLCDMLPGVEVGLLHSRMSTADKQAVMARFVEGTTGVLVSTTVIEVGVDVPNASLMVVEHAERFGLSQLHQLRGRVGRGTAASACVLLYATGDAPRLGEVARERLRAMAETQDGFEIARRDLEIRGPGEFLGARQSGAALLRFADLNTDEEVLAWARDTAPAMLAQFPEQAAQHIGRWLGGRAEYLKA
jgi:ATP-dependent DNA helicase RecG